MPKPEQLVENESLLGKFACPVVIDHLGMVRPEVGLEQPAFCALERLQRRGRTGSSGAATGRIRLSMDLRPTHWT